MAAEVHNLEEIERAARRAISEAPTRQALTEVRAGYLGRKGSVSGILRTLGGLPAAERASVGQAIHATRDRIEAMVAERRGVLESRTQELELAERRIDVTLPGRAEPRGHYHPLTIVMREMQEFFRGLGFSVEEGPDVETEYNNFEALNFPHNHPARDMQDTFFIDGGHVLRTHTSPVQIRAMTGRKPPFRFIAPGRTYRHDSDTTHSPLFHQIEAFLVDERVTFGDLKGVLHAFAHHVMGESADLRFRASFFPFTEPSAEIDFRWQDRWMEWGGCGMIHPKVLENCGIDSERYQGFAFGMGIDRAAMRRFDIPNIHLLFDGDVRVLEQVG